MMSCLQAEKGAWGLKAGFQCGGAWELVRDADAPLELTELESSF